jgi:type IV pilus assembly protein PilN
MRINLNLASHPYEAARLFRRQIMGLVAGLALLAVLLAGYIVDQRIKSRGVNRQLAGAQAEINALEREEAQARAILSRPANRVVAEQSEFLNQLFARKSLSWTRVFSEMERIIPPNLHVVSMKPETTKDNELLLHMMVATDSRDRAVELVRRMEKSSHFRQPQVVAETVTASGTTEAGTGNIQFDIAAIYVPGAQENDTPAQTSSSGAGGPEHGAAAASAKATSPNPTQAQNRAAGNREH